MDLSVSDIVDAAKGRLLGGPSDEVLTGICTDSRNVTPGSLFVPIIGERSDAHAFIDQAFEKGAAATLTSEHDAPGGAWPGRAWIRVDNTKDALQAIGGYARDRLDIPIIGITGSVGKTTTRELTAAALSAKYATFRTAGNQNSQVGVPIMLTEISPDDEIAVLEMGVSIPGEMEKIAAIARVDSAVVTNISSVHIEQMGSRENIMKEKLRIQDGFHKGSVLFVNGDDELLKNVKAADGGALTITFGTGHDCLYRADDISLSPEGSTFTAHCRGKRVKVHLNVAGLHNVINAMAALAVANVYGVDLNDAAGALSAYRGYKNRQRVCEHNGITVIDDTYNAGPASMEAALSVLCSHGGRKIAVLADMKELGSESAGAHEHIGEWLCEHPIDILFTLGDMAWGIEKAAKEGNGALKFYHFAEDERDKLTAKLCDTIKEGDCVLLKGSNSMHLDKVAAALLPGEDDTDITVKRG